jgi:DNA-binding response OmpR family regulator
MTGSLNVLVVDDNEGCRDLYSLWLEDKEVRTAANGMEAEEEIDDEVDLVLLDRNMPGPSGETVAEQFRDDGYDSHIVMVSSEAADFDVFSYPIDDYVQKPVDRSTLQSVVERYREQQSYRESLEEFFALSSKLAAIESNLSAGERVGNEEYDRLKRRVERKRAEVDEALQAAGTDWETAFKSFQAVMHIGTPEPEFADASGSSCS